MKVLYLFAFFLPLLVLSARKPIEFTLVFLCCCPSFMEMTIFGQRRLSMKDLITVPFGLRMTRSDVRT